jgi:hypothetical protein
MTAPSAALDRPGEGRVYPVLTVDGWVEHPNTTGIISVLDPKHLSDWRLKMAMLGAGMRDDLSARIAAAHLLPTGKERNGELRRIAEDAVAAGQVFERGHLANDAGTAKHSLTERLDELVAPGAVREVDELGLPKPLAEIAREYVACMAGVEVILTEVTVCHSAGYAGTIDRVIRFKPLDVHTAVFDQYDLGRGSFAFDAKFGTVHDTVAMQLAAAANAETIWDASSETHSPLPDDLRRDVGFVFNPDKGLIPVDLTGAFEAFLGALAVKRYQMQGIKPLKPALGKRSDLIDVSPTNGTVGGVDERGGGSEPATNVDGDAAPTPSTTSSSAGGAQGREAGVLAAGEVATPPADPTHVSEVLPQAIAAIPDEALVYPTKAEEYRAQREEGKVRCGRGEHCWTWACTRMGSHPPVCCGCKAPFESANETTLKLAWLRDQYDAIAAKGEQGIAVLQQQWPAGTPSMKQAELDGYTYTAEQLVLIEAALEAAGSAARTPFPDIDPTDPAFKHVDNDDPRVLALIERGTALPADLAQDVFRSFKAADVPSLRTGNLNEKRLADADRLISEAEAKWAPRRQRIVDALETAATRMVAERTVLRLFGTEHPEGLTPVAAQQLDAVADAFLGGYLHSSEDGQSVLVDEKAVLDSFPEPCRRNVLDAARIAAKAAGMPSPTDLATALADPILVALLSAT